MAVEHQWWCGGKEPCACTTGWKRWQQSLTETKIMTDDKFEVGDVARLKSGGYPMTVTDVNSNWVWCTYFNEGELRNAAFPSAALEPPPVSGANVPTTVKASQEINHPRKPREWLLCDGTNHERWVVVNEDHLHLVSCEGERVRVREVLE